ncbi:MAG: DinB family protein [Planctomycetaceae bacterium]
MLETVRELTRNQLEAAFCTLNSCIDLCPEEAWNGPVVNLKFCQVAFHTLFFADFYLAAADDLETFQQQPFHQQATGFFRDYEEFQDRPQTLLYDRRTTKTYLDHCRQKALDVVAAESIETLTGRSGFAWRPCSRAELHIYNARHIYHHCAQLSLRLRQIGDIDVPWSAHAWQNR